MEVEALKKFFFEAALATYVGKGVEKTTIPDLPMSKILTYESGDFRYVDLYYTSSQSLQSFGQTTIWHNGIPVWGMQFGGYYPKDVTDFLKAALRQAYEKKIFYGGRGLPRFMQDNLFYTNHSSSNDFTDFFGEERIYRDALNNPEPIGQHWYRGHYLG